MTLISRPEPAEFPSFYLRYVDAVPPERDLVTALDEDHRATVSWLRGVPSGLELHRYAAGKWSVREVIGHIADCERVFAYRLVAIARGDTTSLPGFDQDAWLEVARFDRRPLADLLDEWTAVRDATLALVRTLTEEEAARMGSANGAPISVRALAWIIAGHELHHVHLLQELYGL